MQDMTLLLETIVKGIVNEPDAVSVEQRSSVDFPGLNILEITVADADTGILIGKRGRTINSIRDLMTISAIRHDVKIKVLVKDDRDRRPASSAPAAPVQEAPKPVAETQETHNVAEEPTVTEEENHNVIGNAEASDPLSDDF